MFTGLVSGTGTVTALRPSGPDASVTVAPGFPWEEPLAVGESVAVSGVCLTVTRTLDAGAFEAFASAETLDRTGLGSGRRVNLERALRLCDRLGGHLVSGHVDGPAELIRAVRDGRSLRLAFRTDPRHLRYVAPKGSVCLDGVSLTVNAVTRESFDVNVIPQTLASTTLHDLKPGDRANLEVDLLARYVEALLPSGPTPSVPGGKLLDFLKG
ncbi:MAG: riboflavin synthase [Deltaproteobacteria bacterium]|jgi:riboflavin synthase|nr:riboflavin synthase [Deltaproteobacteria bacterium]